MLDRARREPSRTVLASVLTTIACALLALAFAAPAGATGLPCGPTSWGHGCGGVGPDGRDLVSGQPAHGNYKDDDEQGNATVAVAFSSDGRTATFTGNKGLSNYTVAFCDGTVVNVESVGGDPKTFSFFYGKPICSVRVKAGTTNRTFLSNACTTPDPDPDPERKRTTLAISKKASATQLRSGEQATFTIKVTNTGAAAAEDAQLCEDPDDHWQFVAADGPAPAVSGNDSCYALGSIAAGASKTVKVTLRLVTTALGGTATNTARAWAKNADEVRADAHVKIICVPVPGSSDLLAIQKVEQFVGVPPGEVRTVRLSCPDGYLMTDGGPRVDNVDHGTGTLADVQVRVARSVDAGAYELVLANEASGQAQAHVYGACVGAQTVNAKASLKLAGGVVSETHDWSAGRSWGTLTCPAGSVPIAPGYDAAGKTGVALVTSEPDGDRGWRIGLDLRTPAAVTLSIRCLEQRVPGAGRLDLTHEVRAVEVPAGAVRTYSVICGDLAKGVVASLDLPPDVWLVGHDPQIKSRVFTLFNQGQTPLTATIDLVCLEERTVAGTSCPKAGAHGGGAKKARKD